MGLPMPASFSSGLGVSLWLGKQPSMICNLPDKVIFASEISDLRGLIQKTRERIRGAEEKLVELARDR